MPRWAEKVLENEKCHVKLQTAVKPKLQALGVSELLGHDDHGTLTYTRAMWWQFTQLQFTRHDNERILSLPPSREAIATLCERRGVEVDSINVYLDNSTTPLPLLTTETSWLGGRLIRIRGIRARWLEKT